MRGAAMRALVADFIAGTGPGDLAALADEMLEDPRCHMVLLGGDESGPMLVTVWDEEAVAEVAESLAALEARVRVLVITDPRRA